MTPELQAAAIEAVEKARADNEFAGSLKIKALKFLRDATGLSLPQCVPAVDWALARPRTTLTRAAKERAVAEMTKGLAGISENYVYAVTFPDAFKPDQAKWFTRKQELMRKAIVRVAMARTVD